MATRTPCALGQTGRWAEPDSKSLALFARAQRALSGGNSRTTVYMAPYPAYVAAGEGCWITDVEGDRRLDCLTGLGRLSMPMGSAELEGLVETLAAVLEMERRA